jgi:CheY-like chemotaxis protein
MQTHRILLAEENEIIRLFFRDSFWLHGAAGSYDISFASSFKEAKAIFGQSELDFDIIFLNLSFHIEHKSRNVLDPKAGFELISQIRSNKSADGIKIVVFSSKQYFSFWKKAKKLGADYFLKQDEYLPNHLVTWVEEIMNPKVTK